mmetsp:Transcript_24466/g.57993  ORF Transcript_24466/g.57993 Transcript_24466/m.57993 type:complete len:259 (+) Transcript_24466:440-1216(+)
MRGVPGDQVVHRRTQAEAFADDGVDVRDLLQVICVRIRLAVQYGKRLGPGLGLDLWVLCKEVQGPGQRHRGGIMARQEENPQDRHHVTLRQYSCCIHTRTQQHIQHILRLISQRASCMLFYSLLSPSFQRALNHGVHGVNALLVGGVAWERQSLQRREGQVQRIHQLFHDNLVLPIGVVEGAIDGAEGSPKHGRAKHVQGKARHISFDINVVTSFPAFHQLAGSLVELGHKLPQLCLLKGGVNGLSHSLPFGAVGHDQ